MKAFALAPVLALASFVLLAPPAAEARDRHERSDRYWKRHEQKHDRYESRRSAKYHYHQYGPRYRSHRYYRPAPRYRSHYYRRDYYYDDDYYYDGGYGVYGYAPHYCPPPVRHRHRRPRIGVFLGF